MNRTSRVFLVVAMRYSGWADREMAGWKLLVDKSNEMQEDSRIHNKPFY